MIKRSKKYKKKNIKAAKKAKKKSPPTIKPKPSSNVNSKFAKYEKMKKIKMPMQSIQAMMRTDGFSDDDIKAFTEGKTATISSTTPQPKAKAPIPSVTKPSAPTETKQTNEYEYYEDEEYEYYDEEPEYKEPYTTQPTNTKVEEKQAMIVDEQPEIELEIRAEEESESNEIVEFGFGASPKGSEKKSSIKRIVSASGMDTEFYVNPNAVKTAMRQTYKAGTLCRIHSMTTNKELNGQFGKIVGFKKSSKEKNAEIDIYVVKLWG
eukprot:963787_1